MSVRLFVCLSAVLGLAACPEPEPCDGACAPEACCEGACVDLRTDKEHCGACANSCALPNVVPSCQAGRCAINCVAGFGNCDGERDNGCEFSTASDVNNCGVCGRVCQVANASSVCAEARCAVNECNQHFGDCNEDDLDGCETDLRTTRAHCASCGHACVLANADSDCEASVCRVTACAAGFADCNGADEDGCEINTVDDAENCGACGFACGPGQSCRDAQCRADELIAFGGRGYAADGGGCLGNGPLGVNREVWRFNLATNRFQELAPGGSAPPHRQKHAAAADWPRNRMLVLGGSNCIDDAIKTTAADGGTRMDVWALQFPAADGGTLRWQAVGARGDVPSPRYAAAVAVDPVAWKLYLFGGSAYDATLPPFNERGYSDFYELDLATDTWTRLYDGNPDNSDPEHPSDRFNASAAFDPVQRRFALYGGHMRILHTDLNELWVYDVEAGTWSSSTPTVAPRVLGALYSGSPLYLFSGIRELSGPSPSPLVELGFFRLDVGDAPAWTALNLSPEPRLRFGASAVERDGVRYLHGGVWREGVAMEALRDTWRFAPDAGAWRLLSDGGVSAGVQVDGGSGLPSGRSFGTLIAR